MGKRNSRRTTKRRNTKKKNTKRRHIKRPRRKNNSLRGGIFFLNKKKNRSDASHVVQVSPEEIQGAVPVAQVVDAWPEYVPNQHKNDGIRNAEAKTSKIQSSLLKLSFSKEKLKYQKIGFLCSVVMFFFTGTSLPLILIIIIKFFFLLKKHRDLHGKNKIPGRSDTAAEMVILLIEYIVSVSLTMDGGQIINIIIGDDPTLIMASSVILICGGLFFYLIGEFLDWKALKKASAEVEVVRQQADAWGARQQAAAHVRSAGGALLEHGVSHDLEKVRSIIDVIWKELEKQNPGVADAFKLIFISSAPNFRSVYELSKEIVLCLRDEEMKEQFTRKLIIFGDLIKKKLPADKIEFDALSISGEEKEELSKGRTAFLKSPGFKESKKDGDESLWDLLVKQEEQEPLLKNSPQPAVSAVPDAQAVSVTSDAAAHVNEKGKFSSFVKKLRPRNSKRKDPNKGTSSEEEILLEGEGIDGGTSRKRRKKRMKRRRITHKRSNKMKRTKRTKRMKRMKRTKRTKRTVYKRSNRRKTKKKKRTKRKL